MARRTVLRSWTSWCVIGRDKDGSEWIASHGFNLRSDALEYARTIARELPLSKFVTRAARSEVSLAKARGGP